MQFIDAPLRRAALLSLPKRLLEDASDLKAAGKGDGRHAFVFVTKKQGSGLT